MNQFEQRHTFGAGRCDGAFQPQKSDVDRWATLLEIDRLARHGPS